VTTLPTESPLQVAVEPRPGSRMSLSVEVPPDEVDAAVQAALRRLASRVRLPGFRPGKAPANLVERAVGWEAVRREATERLLPSAYVRALEQAGVDAVDDPELDVGELERSRPLKFTATVTIKPEVDLGDYLSLRVEEERTEISEERVDETIEEVRRRHSELVEVTGRLAQAGDVLRCTLVMRRGDEVLSGGEEQERDVELDRSRLVPGLFDGLVGLFPGQSHSIELTLPEDYSQEELRGVTVTVDATVHAIRERRLPPLDDSLAKLDGQGETLAELREHHRARLTEAAERADAERYEAKVLEELRDRATVDVPQAMVDAEIARQLRDLELRLAASGMRFDRFLEYTGQTVEQLRGERREVAVQRVKLELVLEKLAATEGIEVDESDVEREETQIAGGRKLTPEQRQRVHRAAHRDLLLRGAARRALEIARGEV
jgi:trigger factor